jgi:biopolymer transport protein ExbD
MADIAFLLIIFFLTTALTVSTGLIPGSLDQGKAAIPLPRDAFIQLELDEAGSIMAEGQAVTLAELEAHLTAQQSSGAAYSVALIAAKPNTAWRHVVAVLACLRKAGIQRYSLNGEDI